MEKIKIVIKTMAVKSEINDNMSERIEISKWEIVLDYFRKESTLFWKQKRDNHSETPAIVRIVRCIGRKIDLGNFNGARATVNILIDVARRWGVSLPQILMCHRAQSK